MSPLPTEEFVRAIDAEDYEHATRLLEEHPSLRDAVDPHLEEPMTVRWTVCGSADQLRYLLEQGFSTDARDGIKRSLLEIAVCAGDTDKVQFLLKHGADPNPAVLVTGFTLLNFAVHSGNLEILRLLLDAGASMYGGDNTILAMPPENPAEFALVLEVLLDRGFDVNARTPSAETALIEFARRGRADLVKILLECGADPKIGGVLNMNALDVAITSGETDVVEVLLGAGVIPKGVSAVYDSVVQAVPRTSAERSNVIEVLGRAGLLAAQRPQSRSRELRRVLRRWSWYSSTGTWSRSRIMAAYKARWHLNIHTENLRRLDFHVGLDLRPESHCARGVRLIRRRLPRTLLRRTRFRSPRLGLALKQLKDIEA